MLKSSWLQLIKRHAFKKHYCGMKMLTVTTCCQLNKAALVMNLKTGNASFLGSKHSLRATSVPVVTINLCTRCSRNSRHQHERFSKMWVDKSKLLGHAQVTKQSPQMCHLQTSGSISVYSTCNVCYVHFHVYKMHRVNY